MTTHTFKNGISITLPDDIPKEDLEKRWIDVTMAMSLILYYPPAAQKVPKIKAIPKEDLEKRWIDVLFYPPVAQKVPKIKITRKRKNTWKSPKPKPI